MLNANVYMFLKCYFDLPDKTILRFPKSLYGKCKKKMNETRIEYDIIDRTANNLCKS